MRDPTGCTYCADDDREFLTRQERDEHNENLELATDEAMPVYSRLLMAELTLSRIALRSDDRATAEDYVADLRGELAAVGARVETGEVPLEKLAQLCGARMRRDAKRRPILKLVFDQRTATRPLGQVA